MEQEWAAYSFDYPLVVYEVNHSYQFCYLIKRCPYDIQSEERADRKKTHEERTDNIC